MFAPTTKKMLISAVQRSFERKWKYWCLSRAAPLHPSLDYECSVLLADIQNLNSNAIAPQYFNSNLPRLCQDSTINLLEVLNRPTTDVDFWTALLRGKDGFLQPLKLYATYSGVEQHSGKTKTTWNRSALVEVSCGYQSQPLALCSNSFGLFDFSQV